MMFSVPASIRVFVATTPVDLRRGFDGLAGLTREVLEEDPLGGHLFAFRNRRGDRLKILFFASGGWPSPDFVDGLTTLLEPVVHTLPG